MPHYLEVSRRIGMQMAKLKCVYPCRRTTPLILKLYTIWGWTVNIMSHALYPQYPVNTRLLEHQTSLDDSERRKISYNCQESNPGLSMPQPSHYTAYTIWLSKGRNTLSVSLIQDHDRYVTEMFKKFPVVNNLEGSVWSLLDPILSYTLIAH